MKRERRLRERGCGTTARLRRMDTNPWPALAAIGGVQDVEKVDAMTAKKRRVGQIEAGSGRVPVEPEAITDSMIAGTTLGRSNLLLLLEAIELEEKGRKAEWRDEHRTAWAYHQAALDMVEP